MIPKFMIMIAIGGAAMGLGILAYDFAQCSGFLSNAGKNLYYVLYFLMALVFSLICTNAHPAMQDAVSDFTRIKRLLMCAAELLCFVVPMLVIVIAGHVIIVKK